jgi:ketosteroid isomerase-like protein
LNYTVEAGETANSGRLWTVRYADSMPSLPPADADSIRAIHAAWISMELAGRNSALLDYCAADVLWMPPTEPPISGSAAVAAWLSRTEVKVHSVEITALAIHGGRDAAWLTANYVTTWSVAGGPSQRATGTHLWILRRTHNEWKVQVVAWSAWDESNV